MGDQDRLKVSVLVQPASPVNAHTLSSLYRLNLHGTRQSTRSSHRNPNRKVVRNTQPTFRREKLSAANANNGDSDDESFIYEDSLPPTPTPTPRSSGYGSGLHEYLAFCKRYNVVPISRLKWQLLGNTVTVKYQGLPGSTFKAVAVALLSNETVTSVDLEGSEIGPEGAIHMSDVLQHNNTITELNLSGNKLSPRGLKVLVESLKGNTSLLRLDMSDNGFTEKDAVCLKDLLLSKSKIRELIVAKNKFEDGSGKLIAQGLANNTSVTRLDLSWNHLRGTGAAAIGKSLMNNNTVEVLNVSWNGFDVGGCHGLGQGLTANTSLRELDLSSNRIGRDGMAKLLEGLKRNTTLNILKLGDNPLGPDGALLLLKVLCGMHNIKEIDIGRQPVDDEFANTLKEFQAKRHIRFRHGKVLLKTKPEVGDSTMYIPGDPLLVLLEFTRMKKLDILDLFRTLDADGNHTVTWSEFKTGVRKNRIPVRALDFEQFIRDIDINKDGEINFSELIIAQKNHNMQAEQLLSISQEAFDDSAIGAVHWDLQKWFS